MIPSRFEPCGIVDYESAYLGTVVIGRVTGGLAKVRDFSFMYEWYDMGDWEGERNALLEKTVEALTVFRDDPQRLRQMRHAGMTFDGSWRRSARQYLQMYQYGTVLGQFMQTVDQQVSNLIAHCTMTEAQLLSKYLSAGIGGQRQSLLDQVRQRLHKAWSMSDHG